MERPRQRTSGAGTANQAVGPSNAGAGLGTSDDEGSAPLLQASGGGGGGGGAGKAPHSEVEIRVSATAEASTSDRESTAIPRPAPPQVDLTAPLWPQFVAQVRYWTAELRRNPELLRALALGQVLSLLIATMGVCSETLANGGVDLPTFQGFLNYVLLATVYGGQLIMQKAKLMNDWWKYAVLAFLDVEANFLLVKAYQFTSITSVTLLDCFTVPAVIVLSRAFLGSRYNRLHYWGAGTCLLGLTILVLSDHAGPTAASPHPILGDLCVILGALMYAVTNVAQEKMIVGDVPVREVLGAMGAFGVLIGAAQFGIFEGSKIAATVWGHGTVFPFILFSLALFAFYSLVPKVLLWGGATVLNLSLLSSDVWAAVARVIFFDGFSERSGFLFAVAFLLVAIGLIVYTLAGPARAPMPPRLASSPSSPLLSASGSAALDSQSSQGFVPGSPPRARPKPGPATNSAAVHAKPAAPVSGNAARSVGQSPAEDGWLVGSPPAAGGAGRNVGSGLAGSLPKELELERWEAEAGQGSGGELGRSARPRDASGVEEFGRRGEPGREGDDAGGGKDPP